MTLDICGTLKPFRFSNVSKMPVRVNTTDIQCQSIINILFWRIDNVIGRIYKATKRILENPTKFKNENNMIKLQTIFYDTMIRAKTPIYNEIKQMLGKPNQQPNVSIFLNRLNEVWNVIEQFLLEHVKSVNEETLFENSYLKFHLDSFNRHIKNISMEDHTGLKLFTEEFDAENYITAVEQRLAFYINFKKINRAIKTKNVILFLQIRT